MSALRNPGGKVPYGTIRTAPGGKIILVHGDLHGNISLNVSSERALSAASASAANPVKSAKAG